MRGQLTGHLPRPEVGFRGSTGLPYEGAILKRFISAGESIALFTVAVLLASLPFLLHSGDYIYMTLQYVADVPLQTQSWLVALAGVFGPDFIFLRLSSLLVLLASVFISYFCARRRSSLYLTATLIALSFFLLSQKVVGYYYVILIPFALVVFLPARRFGLLALLVASTAWISLSPYFAPWANPNHLLVYAVLGVANSLLWLGLFIYLWRDLPPPLLAKVQGRTLGMFAIPHPLPPPRENREGGKRIPGSGGGFATPTPQTSVSQLPSQGSASVLDRREGRAGGEGCRARLLKPSSLELPKEGSTGSFSPPAKEGHGEVNAPTLAFLSVVLFFEAVAAALLQPVVNNPTSPIRAPIVPPGLELSVLYASVAFGVIILAVFIFGIALTRGLAARDGFQTRPYLSRSVFAVAVVLAPVYFLTFTCTKESTAIVEMALKSLGL